MIFKQIDLTSDRQSISSEWQQLEQTSKTKTDITDMTAITAITTITETAANNSNDNKPMAQSISNVENGSDVYNGSNGSNNLQCAQNKSSIVKDGKWFLNELNKTTEEIKTRIDLTEQMLEKETDSMNEEMLGKLRAAIGKANLLINKKFKQFRELCLKNIVSFERFDRFC